MKNYGLIICAVGSVLMVAGALGIVRNVCPRWSDASLMLGFSFVVTSITLVHA